jgi:hypothetical protein
MDREVPLVFSLSPEKVNSFSLTAKRQSALAPIALYMIIKSAFDPYKIKY